MNYFEKLARSQVLSLDEYKPGAASTAPDAVRISANENNFGTSDAVVAALRKLLDEAPMLNRYPDITCSNLRQALSAKTGLSPEWFLVGNGLDDVIAMLATTFISDGDEVIVPSVTFGVYANVCSLMGAKVEFVPMKADLSIDIGEIAARITPATKMIWLCNPNNPTGTMIDAGEFDSLIDETLKLDTPPLVVVDQAYIDFAGDDGRYLDAMRRLPERKNVVVLRTMSKISGLAALRLGYAIANPALLALIYRVRQPYTVNSLAQAAAVADVASPDAQKFKETARRDILDGRRELEKFLDKNRVARAESHANFVFAFFDAPYEKTAEISGALAKEDIFVRTLMHRGGPDGIRFSMGTPIENARLIAALEKILAK